MAEQDGGSLVYQVDIDTAKMITGSRKASTVLGEMEKQSGRADASLSKLERQAAATGSTFGTLSRVATAVTAALSFREVMSYADAWTTLNNKLANAVRTNETLADVTERVFQITQDTRSSLNGTATLYARLERATRSYNTSAGDLAKLTTIINQGFVVSGATAQEAEGAIVQLSQGLASGVLRGQEYNSVAEQGSRLSIALADSLGVSIGQLRAMAAQGKLTTDVVVKGLLSQGDAIGREFAKTTMTVGQASQIAGNNITKFVGSSTTVKTGVMVFNDAIITLSENLTAVSNVILAISAVIGSRYVSALTVATAATIANTAAAVRAAIAQGSLRAALVAALTPLGGLVGAATLASAAIFYFYQRAQQAKQEAIDFADKLDGVIAKMRTMSSVQLAAEIDKASQSIRLQSEELKSSEARLTDLTSRLESAKAAVASLGQNNLFHSDAVSKVNQLESEHIQLTAQVDSEQTKLSQTISKTGILRAQMNGTFQQGIDLLKRDGHEASVTAGLFGQLGDAINFAGRAKDKFNSQSLIVERPKNVQDYLDKLNDQVEIQGELNDRKRAQLKAEKDIRALGGSEQDVMLARERAGAEFDATKAIQEQKKATKEGIAEGKKSANQAESAAQKVANLKQQSELAAGSTQELTREQAILQAQLSLGKGATKEQIKLAGQYRAEIWDTAAALKAQNAVPELKENANYASQKAQLQMLKEAKDAQGNLLISQKQFSQLSEQLEREHQVNLARIRAQQATSNPIADARGQVDPIQQLANENSQKLALMKEYQAQELAIIKQSYDANKITYEQFIAAKRATDDQYLALRTAQEKQYQEQQTAAQWQLLSQQSLGYDMLTSAVDAFSGNASNAITGLLTGTMSAQEAMRSLGNTILNSVINSIVQVGVEALKNYILGQTLGAASVASSVGMAATTASAWAPAAAMASLATLGANAAPAAAGITSTVGLAGGLALAGARKNGGPVSAGSMYRVGEGGVPEVLQSSNGRNYLLPGDNGGKVISNKDMQGGSGMPNVVFNVYDQSGGSKAYDYQASMAGDTLTVSAFIADMDNGGPLSQSFTRNHQAPRKATQ
ncbi:Phage-related minor tail protein [Serratia entomophila]|uniref:tape measure protein n=1 Tax=Serratia entomophila TaxID=42906 RepID=UPI0021793EB4|nr:tape measure protein [Serratia entomophila]CAI1782861.1 Phage-related minor tail protein [Serratia entomophila]